MRYRDLLDLTKGMLCLSVAGGLSLAIFGQNLQRIAPIPSDPLELATGQIQVIDSSAGREATVQTLARARSRYTLRSGSQGYDLKVAFTVNSGGQTDYDGPWEMEEMFDPQQGLHWTAKAAAGYKTTQILAKEAYYGEGGRTSFPFACTRHARRY
jgi:hypothetical protein